MRTRNWKMLSGVLALSALPWVSASAEPAVVTALRSPESAAWSSQDSSWYVTSMGGVGIDFGPDAGDGFVTKIEEDSPVGGKWLEGLDRPRGIVSFGPSLIVAERGGIAIIDKATAVVGQRIPIPAGNGDLNDVAFDASTGTVFVSAPSVDAIFSVTGLGGAPVVDVFAQGQELTQPNGLWVDNDFVYAAGLGLGSAREGFGKVMRVDRRTRAITSLTLTGIGLLDGLVADGDDLLVTEYSTGNLYRLARDGTLLLEAKFLPSSADLGIDPVRRVIAVPETVLGTVVFYELL